MKIHHSLNKSCNNAKNPSPQFINYLKDKSELPFKENTQPKQNLKQKDYKDQLKKETNKKSRVVEGDFSRIACSYVLEGNQLRKQEAYEDIVAKQKKKQDINANNTKGKDKQNLNKEVSHADRKEILKLEYLEKMGFLRPEEQQMLANYRKNNGTQNPKKNEASEDNNYHQEAQYKNKKAHAEGKTLKPYPENTMNAYQQVPFYSPKYTDQKKISQFFSPNKLPNNHYGYQHSYAYPGGHY